MRIQNNASGYEGKVNLYEPYSKIPTGLQLLKLKKSNAKHKGGKSVNVKRAEPLAKVILDRFEETLENNEFIVDNIEQLKRKNKLTDYMDDYYSRHISKEGAKPDHLFLFKAKPIIPPGRILLDMEREKEKNKVKSK